MLSFCIYYLDIIIINTSPTDCHASGADASYGYRHVVLSADLLAGYDKSRFPQEH